VLYILLMSLASAFGANVSLSNYTVLTSKIFCKKAELNWGRLDPHIFKVQQVAPPSGNSTLATVLYQQEHISKSYSSFGLSTIGSEWNFMYIYNLSTTHAKATSLLQIHDGYIFTGTLEKYVRLNEIVLVIQCSLIILC
jgi:hypothetical protein